MQLSMAVLTVSELNHKAMQIVRNYPDLQLLLLEGEIANLKIQDSGHLYFSLRDKESSVKAVMFRHLAENLRFEVKNGIQVIASANADIYSVSGTFQLHVTDMLLQGLGSVQRGLEQRKNILYAEGIFNNSVKKQIPEEPNKIGLITSSKGAVLQDMLKILERRCPLAEIILFPAKMQGKQAESEICQALAIADTQDCDVLILGRGGGSAEDLDIFNSEKIVRAVYSCQTPVISAIGHETDITLTDAVADLRASTPSVGAELATQKIYPEILLNNKLVESVKQVQTGDMLKICLPDGCIRVKVESEENNFMNDNNLVNKQLAEYAERVQNYMHAVLESMQKQ
ncbi:MAG: exodeoxyribonuclease VII large subunit, partial [Oscillospiraceae bacterium]|nr:exodeoxyribonuclease VII large subunit [Oscillospiraceae bacterium]